jgi:hypothetical protein
MRIRAGQADYAKAAAAWRRSNGYDGVVQVHVSEIPSEAREPYRYDILNGSPLRKLPEIVSIQIHWQ